MVNRRVKKEIFSFILQAVHPKALEAYARGKELPLSLPHSIPLVCDEVAVWKAILKQAQQMKVLWPLLIILKGVSWREELAEEIREFLSTETQRIADQEQVIRKETEYAVRALVEQKLRVLVVGGVDLGKRYYSDPTLRVAENIELIVSKESFGVALRALGRKGYRQVGDGLGEHSLLLARESIPDVPQINLRTRLMEEDEAEYSPADWERSVGQQISHTSGNLRVLAPEELIVFLIKRGIYRDLLDSPVWLLDLYFVIQMNQKISWEKIERDLKNLEGPAYLALKMVKELGCNLPLNVINRFTKKMSALKKSRLKKLEEIDSWFNVESSSLLSALLNGFCLGTSQSDSVKQGVRLYKRAA